MGGTVAGVSGDGRGLTKEAESLLLLIPKRSYASVILLTERRYADREEHSKDASSNRAESI